MQQLSIEYFWPLTEQINLDLDFTPCENYNQYKIKNSTVIGNRIDQWSIYPNGCTTASTVISNHSLIVYPESQPITFRTEKKPNILTRIVYKALGVKWEKSC